MHLLGGILAGILSFAISILANCTEPATTNVLHVTGIGTSIVQQETFQVQLSVENHATTAKAAHRLTSDVVGAVLGKLAGYNVTHLETGMLSLMPVYNYTSDTLTGYDSLETVSFWTSPEAVGEILDAMVAAGVTHIDAVNAIATPEQLNAAHDESVQNAVTDAADQAHSVASALHVCIETPIQIDIRPSTTGSVAPVTLAAAAPFTSSSISSQPTILPGNTTVTATVNVDYSHTAC